jgi:dihydroorotase
MIPRRQFLRAAAGASVVLGTHRDSLAAEYDLLVRGGRIIDPSQGIDRIADLAVRGSKIAAIRSDIPTSSAAECIDARGKLVVPGLIDIHVHVADPKLSASDLLPTGCTCLIDAGSRGADNVDELIAIARNSPNRLRIFLNIARLGNAPAGRGEFLDGIEPADVGKARAAVERNREWIVGIKARLSRAVAGDLDVEVLRRTREVADATKIPIMIHVGGTASPLPKLVSMLRPGDIVTHFTVPDQGITDDRGQIFPEIHEARRRGVLFDFGNGLVRHWSWDRVENILHQQFLPDTISTDLNPVSRTEQVFDLPNVLTRFLMMRMPLNQVIACATSHAAHAIPEFRAYGTLRQGSPADITVLENAKGNFEFVDNYKGQRNGSEKLVTRAVVMGGKRVV